MVPIWVVVNARPWVLVRLKISVVVMKSIWVLVSTGICVVVQADVVRYRPVLLVLAAGKTASSLGALGFYVFDSDVFIYLLNFIVDGFLVGVSLLLWKVAGQVGEPAAPS